ncbi:acetyl-CoA carboxylase biotin carboxyl carrier protein [Adhaeretor mobilis]|uniref:Biotin carboxyl carrier protein of acetyl-CoA carboxylase n=1 Tax=Adhaeretor mobilis TaxID=1930276 RepID=A0A517MYB2_9BACT|nr:acetyl-CoA carboxylase biotin carboxyl carrier protein [Adhaeretor mobilis]QDS99868.1 Acetyl-CoA biotin carboxyl carrier [Adhaeretor mobilis]
MASGGTNPSDVFDVRKVRRLVELMNEYELGEIDLKQGDQRIRLRKDGDLPVYSAPTAAAAPAHAAPQAAPATAGGEASGTAPAVADNANYITSPMVGTFYATANPDSPPFVKVGDQVGGDTVVCIIEAMKVFNEIAAECSGKIAAVLVENGDPVEFGQKLFQVE